MLYFVHSDFDILFREVRNIVGFQQNHFGLTRLKEIFISHANHRLLLQKYLLAIDDLLLHERMLQELLASCSLIAVLLQTHVDEIHTVIAQFESEGNPQ